MKMKYHSHKFAMQIIENTDSFNSLWREIEDSIAAISDKDLITHYQREHEGRTMSLSKTINTLLKAQLVNRGWSAESPIFAEGDYQSSRWRLDFAKGG